MAKITKIEVQKKNKERVNLFLDEEYAFSLSMELVYKEGLKKNQEIDAKRLELLAEEESIIRCKKQSGSTRYLPGQRSVASHPGMGGGVPASPV